MLAAYLAVSAAGAVGLAVVLASAGFAAALVLWTRREAPTVDAALVGRLATGGVLLVPALITRGAQLQRRRLLPRQHRVGGHRPRGHRDRALRARTVAAPGHRALGARSGPGARRPRDLDAALGPLVRFARSRGARVRASGALRAGVPPVRIAGQELPAAELRHLRHRSGVHARRRARAAVPRGAGRPPHFGQLQGGSPQLPPRVLERPRPLVRHRARVRPPPLGERARGPGSSGCWRRVPSR